MFSEETAVQVIEPAMLIENGAGKHVPRYRVEIDMEQMTWGDNMIQVKFQLLMETADDLEGSTKAQRIDAYRQLIDGFGELTAFLDRIAIVYRDGVQVSSVAIVPMHFIKEIMASIRKAQADQGNSKN